MKYITQPILAATIALSTMVSSVSLVSATDVTLDGYGSYKLNYKEKYAKKGKKQTGRYKNLGADYYRKAKIKVDVLQNRSSNRSGSLSFELWAMPFYGASSGTVLMTKAGGNLKGFKAKKNFSKGGQALSLDERAFPELNLWEYTRSGWVFRDSIQFSAKELL